MTRRALAVALLALALTARAQPHPTPEVVAAAAARLPWLASIKAMTNDARIVNLALFYGREFESRVDPGDSSRINVYLISRSKPGGPITFMWLIGSLEGE